MTDIAVGTTNFRVGRVLTQSFSVYFGNFVPFVLLALVVSSPVYIYKVLSGPAATNVSDDPTAYFSQLSAEPFILYFAELLLSQLVTAALVYGTIQHLKHEKVSLGECFSRGVALMFPVFGIVIVYLLIMMLVAVITILPAGLIVALVAAGTGFAVLGFVLVPLSAIPIIYIMVVLWVTIPVAVIERRGLGSFNRSTQMTKGFRWRIFALLILVLGFGVGMGMLIGGLGNAAAFASPDQFAGQATVEWIIGGLMTAFSAVIAAVSYHDLRIEKEGLDTNQIASVFD